MGKRGDNGFPAGRFRIGPLWAQRWRVRRPGRLCWLCICAFATSGCCLSDGIRREDAPRPTARTSWAAAGIDDLRAQFRPVFCRYYDAAPIGQATCEQWLHGPIPRTDAASSRRNLAVPDRRTLIVVPGIFGECVAEWVTPYSFSHAELGQIGYEVIVLPLEGRASSARNAELIHRHLRGRQLNDAVVVAYSKGVTDFMLAATQPQAATWLPQVAVLISVAGTANGSPLGARAAGFYQALLADLPFAACGPSDGGGIDSLRYRSAMAVADAFAALAPEIASYSVIAVADVDRINPVLAPFHSYLSQIDQRNDGQVLMEDAVVPRSQVLGVFNADHWSIALPFAQSPDWQMRPLSINNAFPRAALIQALLEFTAPVTGNAREVEP